MHQIDAHRYAVALFGDSIAANMFMLGFAYQRGLIPVTGRSIEEAIRLNGAAVEMNLGAFAAGRIAVTDITALDAIVTQRENTATQGTTSHDDEICDTLERVVAHRRALLTAYQDAPYADHFVAKVRLLADRERAVKPGSEVLAMTAARGLAKLMAYVPSLAFSLTLEPACFETNCRSWQLSVIHTSPGPVLGRWGGGEVVG